MLNLIRREEKMKRLRDNLDGQTKRVKRIQGRNREANKHIIIFMFLTLKKKKKSGTGLDKCCY